MKRNILWAISLRLLCCFALSILAVHASAAEQEKVLHLFQASAGAFPAGNLIFDAAGNLYGTTQNGGSSSCPPLCGTVFELTPAAGGHWNYSVLHVFTDPDGAYPWSGLIFDKAGNLYGTTSSGGAHAGGTVFELTPTSNGGWKEKTLHNFYSWRGDGVGPMGGLVMDQAGNLYGTTLGGGACNNGTVFKVSPNASGGWIESVLYSFGCVPRDGTTPRAPLVLDSAGDLFGTTNAGGGTGCGGFGCGTVFELSHDGTVWTETVLYTFQGGVDAGNPLAGLLFDSSGDLYGTAPNGGTVGDGAVFELTPSPTGWNESVIYSFQQGPKDGNSPRGSLIFDSAGNLHGTASSGGIGNYGGVFTLTPNSNGGWTESDFFLFSLSGGAFPMAALVLDSSGNLYGTTYAGGVAKGVEGYGVVFEIKP